MFYQLKASLVNTSKTIVNGITLMTLMSLAFVSHAADVNQAKTVLINDDWQYLANNDVELSNVVSASAWQLITLPHTWNATDTVNSTPGYRRDASWYRKTLALPSQLSSDVRYQLYFEGVNMEAKFMLMVLWLKNILVAILVLRLI